MSIVSHGNYDLLKYLDYLKQEGYPAGTGAHNIRAMPACFEAGVISFAMIWFSIIF